MTKVSTGDGFLSMNCTSPSSQRRSGVFTPSPIKGFDLDAVLCDKGKKMWCMWWDNRGLPQIRSVPINSNWRWHRDHGEVCVWMYDRSSTAEGVDDARLEMFARSCHQVGIIISHAVSSIPARHSDLCRLSMEEEENIWQIFWTYLLLLRRDASSWLNVAANQYVMGGANDTAFWLKLISAVR